MMEARWHRTRARLTADAPAADAPELWSRIAASRRAGTAVELPARDPRRPVSPVLLTVLLVVAVAAGTVLRQRGDWATPIGTTTILTADPDMAAFDWLTAPAYAQGNGISTLPPIDAPDLSRMMPSRLVYQHADGADGFFTQQAGTDTYSISRDTVDGVDRVVLVHTDRQGVRYLSGSSLDSVALAVDGRLLFWDVQASRFGRLEPTVTLVTTLLPDSVRFTFLRRDGTAPKTRVRPARYEYQVRDILLALLPALPLQLGYARSLSVLDLIGGETTPAFTRSIEMRVTDKAWITVPAGRFHCWVVEYAVVPYPGEPRYTNRLLVDMASGVLVRAEWTGGTFSAEQVLVDRRHE